MKWKIPLLIDLNGKVIEKDDEIALLQHQTVVVCFNTGCANEKACISGDNPVISYKKSRYSSDRSIKHRAAFLEKRECSDDLCSYSLQLSSSQKWNFSTTDKALLTWLKELAGIIELSAGTIGGGRQMFCSIENDQTKNDFKATRQALINNGWQCHNLPALSVLHHELTSDVLCHMKHIGTPVDKIKAMRDILYPLYRDSINQGGILFHAGLIEKEGKGVVLAGRTGAGKSTCCKRLPDQWKTLCDDEILVVLGNDGVYRAHPFPTWSEYLNGGSAKTWNVQYSVPLCGVFFIEQSDLDASVCLGQGKAAFCMNESALQVYRKYWSMANDDNQRKFLSHLFDNSCEMAKKIPAFNLRVSLYGCFWEEIERTLGWQECRHNS